MHLIKSAPLLVLFACLSFSASAVSVAVAKDPLAAATPATTVSPGEQVSINTVDEVALIRRLNGIGEPKARAILEYRAAHGPFISVNQLLEMKGVGPALLEKDQSRIAIEWDAAEGANFRPDNEKTSGVCQGLWIWLRDLDSNQGSND